METKTTTKAALKNEFKYSPMSEGITAKPRGISLKIIQQRTSLVFLVKSFISICLIKRFYEITLSRT